jgi:uncharacterized membrane protein
VDRDLLTTRPGRAAAVAIGVLVLVTAIAIAVLYPSGGERDVRGPAVTATEAAKVTSVRRGGCEQYAGPNCRVAAMRLEAGPNRGETSFITLGTDRFSPPIAPGDAIRVARNLPAGIDEELGGQLDISDPAAQPYAFVDFERRAPLLWLIGAFAVLVVVLARRQGARALLALLASLVLVVAFVVPAILAGRSPVLVALAGGLGVMILTTVITYGTGVKSQAAMLGTTVSLLVIAGLAALAVKAAQITGFASEEALLLQGYGEQELSLQGLVLAGVVIGALGVLDDVTVSQASTVLALRRANPLYGLRKLFGEALAVGRDHLGATVNTLVLAYVGASLPTLLIFSTNGVGISEGLNREPVATQVVAMLVGSIGLVAAVPLTTLLAAVLAVRLPADRLPEGDVHHH